MKFLDEASIYIRSGDGGAGCVHFRREKFIPRGGPDGGDGGKGGDILFKADPNLSTLIDFRYNRRYIAQSGEAGKGKKGSGANMPDILIRVPVGTVIRDQQTQELLADLAHPQQVYHALKGGRGGKGNHFFRSSTQQAPQYSQPGMTGEERQVLLELKLLADVGLIGLPNAGKSTLISRISNAKPKIADYPFTTLVPNLGVVRVSEEKSFVVADIPGLIEGAHQGVGLGTKFLKHIERTKLFLHLIDISEKNPLNDFKTINRELGQYNPHLLKKRQLVVLTKTDLVSSSRDIQTQLNIFNQEGIEAYAISAVQGLGIKQLIQTLAEKLQ